MYDSTKRENELRDIFESIGGDFLGQFEGCKFKNNYGLDKIMFYYETLLTIGIKPAFLEEINLSIYKVASALEFVVLHSQPIVCDSPKVSIEANVRLAVEIAKQFIFSRLFNGENEKGLLSEFEGFSDKENVILLRHEEYLMVTSSAENILDYSVLANGLFWEALFCSAMKK